MRNEVSGCLGCVGFISFNNPIEQGVHDLSVHLDIPLKIIEVSVSKKVVNRFLPQLWDKFNEVLGRVGCVHYYVPTSNPEVYIYRVHWADRDLHFEAELQFFNHTSKGITSIAYGAIDRESRTMDDGVVKQIGQAIKSVVDSDLSESDVPASYVCVPFSTPFKLAGNYHLDLSDLLLIKVDDEGECTAHLFVPIYSKNNADINQEAMDVAVRVGAVLTTLTQNLFFPLTNLKWGIYTSQDVDYTRGKYLPCGVFADDSGFLKYRDSAPITHKTFEIIEARDCVKDSLLMLPLQTDLILKYVLEQDDFQQACNRFAEALYLRNLTENNILPLQIMSYELMAYTATVESLLDSGKKITEIKCANCSHVLLKEDWKISEKYKAFIIELCTNDDLYKRFFKPLYEDRSKFVHTGKDLYDFNARRPGRPSVLMGKRVATRTPDYYGNIHELTGWLVRKHFYLRSLTTVAGTS